MTSTDFAIRDDICANYTRDKGSEVIIQGRNGVPKSIYCYHPYFLFFIYTCF